MPPSFPDSASPAPATGAAPDYRAALSRLAHRAEDAGVIAVGGADRVAFLQGQLTQDVESLAGWESRATAGLTSKGKLLYAGRVVALPDSLLIVVPAASRRAVLAHLSKYAVFQKVDVRDASQEFGVLDLYGPQAGAVETPPGAARLPADGELAASILAPARLADELERRAADAGSVPLSAQAAEILRVEAGRPELGRDADESNLPDEVGLEGTISTTKGCYVGQEVVARLRTYGRVNRRLVGFRFPRGGLPAGTVFPDPAKPGHELGRVTSAVDSPRFGPIGLGLAFREIPEGGRLETPEAPERHAVVSALPFA